MILVYETRVCSVISKAMLVALFVVFPIAVVLVSYVRSQLIKSYGWGVFWRYPMNYVHGALLSRFERNLYRFGIGLIWLFMAIFVMFLVTHAYLKCANWHS